jgi:hypothetical protein
MITMLDVMVSTATFKYRYMQPAAVRYVVDKDNKERDQLGLIPVTVQHLDIDNRSYVVFLAIRMYVCRLL